MQIPKPALDQDNIKVWINANIQIQNPVLDKDKILVKINASVQIQNPIAHVLIEVKLSKRTQLLI